MCGFGTFGWGIELTISVPLYRAFQTPLEVPVYTTKLRGIVLKGPFSPPLRLKNLPELA